VAGRYLLLKFRRIYKYLITHKDALTALFLIVGTIGAIYFGTITLQSQEATFYPTTAFCPYISATEYDTNTYKIYISDQNFTNLGEFTGILTVCYSVENAFCGVNSKKKCCSQSVALESGRQIQSTQYVLVKKDSTNFKFTESIITRTKSNPNPQTPVPIRNCECRLLQSNYFNCTNY